MKKQRKMLYISVFINFLAGIIIGTVLFYGQMRAATADEGYRYVYDSNVTFTDFFRASWMNLIWIFSALAAQCISGGRFIHPVVAVRGCVSSFSALYILNFFGIAQMAASVLPQCISSLPLLSFFSVECTIRRRENLINGAEHCKIKRSEAAAMLILSIIAGGAEVMFFRFLCTYLF